MEVRYRREMNHNYMIMDAPAAETGYECRMLTGNHIEGLLKFRVRYGEEKREFYYEITSRQPLKRVLEKRKATGEEIRRVLLAILTTVGRVEEFLLKEEQLLLEPEYIYIDPDRFSVELCLLPGYSCSWPAALSSLLRFLLEKADHQDKDAVVLAYNLYQESLKENYGAADLLKHLSLSEDRIFSLPDEVEEEKDIKTGKIEIKEEACQDDREWKGAEEEKDRSEDRRASKEKMYQTPSRHRKRCSVVLKGILALAAVEALLWYISGIDSLWVYGAVTVVGLVILILFLFFGRNPHHSKNTKELVSQEPFRRPETNEWEMKVEREDIYQARMREKEEEEMRKSREEGTVLLTAAGESSRIGVLESLSQDAESIEISYVPFVIGKHPQLTDYCLSRPTVSRLHLRIDRKENVCILTDLNSTNGTIVNGYQLQANETVSIKTGDILYIAEVGFKFSENLFL